MRLMLTTALAASLVTSPLYAAECMHPADHAAMDVMGLKTQLMVTALTCKEDDRYNAFVRKYQSDLQREDKSLTSYFSRAYGRSGQKQRDDFVTQLANSRSQTGLRQGSLFCAQNVPAFEEVMALKSNAELAEYAAGRSGEQQTAAGAACGATPVHAPTRTATRRR